ncbi:MAG: hypothetical protein KAJ35_06490 [Thermoplasmata archaeon]|nr:hypothetical protein [Thermoplasmata archaeon]
MLESVRRLPLMDKLLARPLLAVLLVVILIVAGLAAVSVSNYTTSGGDDGPRPTAEWLTVHYVSMDNNLDAFGEWQADLWSLEKVGATPESHHIALYDGDEDGDTIVQYVVEGGVEEMPTTDVDPSWGPELNLGDPETLIDFTVWAATEYPADKICLVLNNHGGGWFGICWDDTDEDFLPPSEVAEALASIHYNLGRKVDVVLCYACLMASTEFAYEIHEHADYLIASETFSWGSETLGEDDYLIGNYPFDAIWGPVKDNPEMTPREFAVHAVDAFQMYGPWNAPDIDIYRDYSSDTVSAIDLSAMPALVAAVDNLGLELEASLTGLGRLISHAQLVNRVIGSPEEPEEYCTESFSGQPDFIGQGTWVNYDLLDFIEQLEKCDIKELCNSDTLRQVRDAVGAAIIAERHGTDESLGHHVDAHGLSIWIPYRSTEYRDSYETTAFARDTSWDEFLKAANLI